VYLVTRGHFRSRDKDGGHTIRSVNYRIRKPHAARKLYGFLFYRIGLLPQPKNTGYNLRQRTHDLTLPTDISAIMKQNFVYRMLFRDIY